MQLGLLADPICSLQSLAFSKSWSLVVQASLELLISLPQPQVLGAPHPVHPVLEMGPGLCAC